MAALPRAVQEPYSRERYSRAGSRWRLQRAAFRQGQLARWKERRGGRGAWPAWCGSSMVLLGAAVLLGSLAVAPRPFPLRVLSGRPVDPYLFGWNLEEWASVLNLTFADSAGTALADALHPGVLRYPGGTNSNIWDTISGRFVHPIPSAKGYSRYNEFEPWIGGQPNGTFSGESFLRGLGGRAKRVLWDLNVYSLNASQACDQIRYISALPGQQEPGVYLELGNELDLAAQGQPRFPTSKLYAEAMEPIVACARRLMPHAKIATLGATGMSSRSQEWERGLRPYLHLFDGVTLHDYSPGTSIVDALPPAQRVSFVAGYSRARLKASIAWQQSNLGGASLPLLLTEFGYGLDPSGHCMLGEQMKFGALHGAFHAARVLAAINEPPGAVGALTFETFVFRDPGAAGRPDCPNCADDWCGMAAGTCHQATPNRPDLARVSGMAQLVSHLFARALASETMHAVNTSGAPLLDAPTILGERQPCLQAAAFGSGGGDGSGGGGGNMSVAVLNICNHTLLVALDTSVRADKGSAASKQQLSAVQMTTYDLHDRGGKSALPAQPDDFPWPAPLTRARRTGGLSPDALAITPLSFAIIELHF